MTCRGWVSGVVSECIQIRVGVSSSELEMSRMSSLVSVGSLALRGFLGAGGVGVPKFAAAGVPMVIGAMWVVQMLDLGRVLGLSQLCKPLMAVTSSRLWVAASQISSMVSVVGVGCSWSLGCPQTR